MPVEFHRIHHQQESKAWMPGTSRGNGDNWCCARLTNAWIAETTMRAGPVIVGRIFPVLRHA